MVNETRKILIEARPLVMSTTTSLHHLRKAMDMMQQRFDVHTDDGLAAFIDLGVQISMIEDELARRN